MRKLSQHGKSVNTSIRLPEELRDKVKATANSFGLSSAEYIRLVLSLAVNGRLDVTVAISKEKP